MAGPWEKYKNNPSPAPSPIPNSSTTPGPWEKYQSQQEPADTGPSKSGSALQGFGQAGLIGYLPEAQAAAGGLIPRSPGFDEEEFQKPDKYGQTGKIVEPESTYQSRLKEFRTEQEEYKNKNTSSYMAGQAVGALATAPAYGKALGAVGALSKIPKAGILFDSVGAGGEIAAGANGLGGLTTQGLIQGARGGALMGFAANPNESPNDGSDFNLPKRVENMGKGAAFGGALGALSGRFANEAGMMNAPKQIPSEPASPELNNTVSVDEPPAGGGTTSGAPKITDQKPTVAPKSLEDLKSQVDTMKKEGTIKDLPSADRLDQISKNNPDLPKPIPGFHDEMLKSNSGRLNMRAIAESPTEAGDHVRAYEQGMKQAAESKLADLVGSVGDRPPMPNVEAGEELMGIVKSAHEQNKAELGPVFDQYQNMRLPKQKIVPEIQNQLVTDIPKLKGYLTFDGETGELMLKPFTPKMGITEQAHSALGKTVEALNSENLSFKDMQNIREYLRQSIDPTNPKATQVLSEARKSMLDYMQDLVQSKSQGADVRGTFKKYAINEKNLEQFEQIIGGKIENADQLMNANPERVMDRVFSSTNNVKVTRQIVGDKAFKNLTADYVNNLIQKSTNNGVVSSNKLMTALKQKEPALVEAIGDQKLEQRLRDLVDYMRLVPDTAPINPSGTAQSVFRLKNLMHPQGLVHDTLGAVQKARQNSKVGSDLDQRMSGQADQPPATANIYKRGLLPALMNPTLRR